MSTNINISKLFYSHYQLNLDESVSTGIKRIIIEQSNQAMWQLNDRSKSQDKRIYDARKCIKKIRAALRLVQDEIGKKLYKRENIYCRDASRLLAAMRDSAVLVKIFDRVCKHYNNQLGVAPTAHIRSQLIAQQQHINKRAVEQENSIDQAINKLNIMQNQIIDLSIRNRGFTTFDKSLHRIYLSGRNQFKAVYEAPSPELFHQWRKQVKYLRCCVRILNRTNSDQLDKLVINLGKLGSWLGDDHDLFALYIMLKANTQWFNKDDDLQKLLIFIDCWRQELEVASYNLGQQIYAKRSRDYIAWMQTDWQLSQPEKMY